MKVLVMDRGYWGARLLLDLKRREGVDFVVRAGNDKLDVVKNMDGLAKLPATLWHERQEDHSRLGRMRVKMAGITELPLFDERDRELGTCRGVIAEEYDIQGQRLPERPRFHYITSLAVDPLSADSVQAVRTYYRRRWSVENQGFWVLTKRWNLDTIVARNLDANRARLNFALQLYNTENCCAWKHPGTFQEELPRLKRPARGDRLGRPSIMVYTPDGKVGAFQVREYRDLVTQAVERAVQVRAKKNLKADIAQALQAGKSIEEILRDL